jgi:hypothetical protein
MPVVEHVLQALPAALHEAVRSATSNSDDTGSVT